MSVTTSHRGGVSVGHLHDLDSVASAAIVYLRMWSDGYDGQSQIQQGLIGALGDDRGAQAFEVFAHLQEMCSLHARRPLLHHDLHCKCVGADEACFGHFVATAAEGEAADALLFATLIVRPDVAPVVAGLASQFGLALKQINRAFYSITDAVYTTTQTIH